MKKTEIEFRAALIRLLLNDHALSALLQRAKADRLDYHALVASTAAEVPIASVTPAQRAEAKALGFAYAYGYGGTRS